MPTPGELRKKIITAGIISKTLEQTPAPKLPDSNPYKKYAYQLYEGNVNSKSMPQISEAVKNIPKPPTGPKPKNTTPKSYFVKGRGENTRRKKNRKQRKNRKHKTKKLRMR